jgi:hypothetical protein
MTDVCDDCGREHESSQKVDMKPGLWGLICIHCRWFNHRGDSVVVSKFLNERQARADRRDKLEDAIERLNNDTDSDSHWDKFMYSNEFLIVIGLLLIVICIRN